MYGHIIVNIINTYSHIQYNIYTVHLDVNSHIYVFMWIFFNICLYHWNHSDLLSDKIIHVEKLGVKTE